MLTGQSQQNNLGLFRKSKLARAVSLSLPLILSSSLAGCGDDNLNPNDIGAPDTYDFESRNDPSALSSVDYREATTRLILIKELEYLIGSTYLQEYGKVKGRTKEDVMALLNRVYQFGTASLAISNLYDVYDPLGTEDAGPTPIKGLTLLSGLPLKQSTYSQLSPNTNLKSAMPGIAYDLQYKDGDGDPAFIGWSSSGISDKNLVPDHLIQLWFGAVARLAIDGDNSTRFIHYESGRDFQQLITSFLMGAIAYGQSMNNHLLGGLNSDHTDMANGENYTQLQHQWDMAFGYYGAAQQLNLIDKQAITKQPDHNYVGTDIDAFSEYTFTYPVDAAQRDLDTRLADTKFYSNPIQAFLNGRQIIDNYFPVTTENSIQLNNELSEQANTITKEWEKTIVATALHNLNITAELVLHFGQQKLVDAAYINVWSLTKGYTLALQFNPKTKFSYEDFTKLHELIGPSPELNDEDNNASDLFKYQRELHSTHTLFQQTYGFSTDHIQNW